MATTGDIEKGSDELTQHRLEFMGDVKEHRVYARAVNPNAIEICTCENLEKLQGRTNDFENFSSLNLLN